MVVEHTDTITIPALPVGQDVAVVVTALADGAIAGITARLDTGDIKSVNGVAVDKFPWDSSAATVSVEKVFKQS